MSLVTEIRQICLKYNFKPLHRRGQNFLINQRVYDKIIETAELKKDDIILEIGAGLGTLTKKLAKHVKKVIAVEIDRKLVEILRKQLKDYNNIEIIQGDILDEKVLGYIGKQLIRERKNPSNQLPKRSIDYKLVANLPYNITGAVLRKFLTCETKPKLMVLMLQKEVTQRIVAKPSKMSVLSVMVQFYSQPKIISYVSKNNFWPRPRVDSAILKITQIHTDKNTDTRRFFEVVKAGFSAPRKYLFSNLVKKNIFNKELGQKIFQQLGFNLKIRAEELSTEDWIKLYNIMQIYK